MHLQLRSCSRTHGRPPLWTSALYEHNKHKVWHLMLFPNWISMQLCFPVLLNLFFQDYHDYYFYSVKWIFCTINFNKSWNSYSTFIYQWLHIHSSMLHNLKWKWIRAKRAREIVVARDAQVIERSSSLSVHGWWYKLGENICY